MRTFYYFKKILNSLLSEPRDYDGTWVRVNLFGEPGSTARWELDGDTITVTGGTAINPRDTPLSGGRMFDNAFTYLGQTQRNAVTIINIDDDITVTGIMEGAFANFPNLTAINGLERIDTADVTNMGGMFQRANSLTELDLSGWSTGNVTDMNSMFVDARSLTTLDLSGWDTRAVTNMGMFYGANSLNNITFGRNFVGRDFGSLSGNWMRLDTINTTAQLWSYLGVPRDYDGTWVRLNLFGAAGSTARWELDGDTITVTSGAAINPSRSVFDSLDVAQRNAVTTINIEGDITATGSMWSAFADFPNLTAINGIERINTAAVTDMDWMFDGSGSLTELNLSGWDTGNVTGMYRMFLGAGSLQRITFGRDFISVGFNSLSQNIWQNLSTGVNLTSFQLWEHLRVERDYDETWVWEGIAPPIPTPSPTPTPTPPIPMPTPWTPIPTPTPAAPIPTAPPGPGAYMLNFSNTQPQAQNFETGLFRPGLENGSAQFEGLLRLQEGTLAGFDIQARGNANGFRSNNLNHADGQGAEVNPNGSGRWLESNMYLTGPVTVSMFGRSFIRESAAFVDVHLGDDVQTMIFEPGWESRNLTAQEVHFPAGTSGLLRIGNEDHGFTSGGIMWPWESYAIGGNRFSVQEIAVVVHGADVPIVVTATGEPERVRLTWNHVPSAFQYEVVFRLAGTPAWNNTFVSGTAHTVSGLITGQTYEFRVRAWDSPTWSEIVTAIPEPIPPPQTAPSVSLGSGSERITASWVIVEFAQSYELEHRGMLKNQHQQP